MQVALVADYLEEGWPSMDLVAEELLREAGRRKEKGEGGGNTLEVELIRPAMKRRFSNMHSGHGFTADRLLARFVDYSRYLRRRRGEFDLFHLVDHSYSQLVHVLPANRTVVTCHDVDTFRCLWEPGGEGRGMAFRIMTQRILSGMRKAAHVCCDSASTRDEILTQELLPASKLSVVPLGVHRSYLEQVLPAREREIESTLPAVVLQAAPDAIDLLHVGSVIVRKRVDVLLQVFARVRERFPSTRLLRVGGRLTAAQDALAQRLGIVDAVHSLPFLTAEQLALVYRRAAMVLLPSEAEGFGFPVVEAMASGTPIVASDLPVLREVGGTDAVYAPAGDVDGWVTIVSGLLAERVGQPDLWRTRCERGRAQAVTFTWAETAKRMIEVYQDVLARTDQQEPKVRRRSAR